MDNIIIKYENITYKEIFFRKIKKQQLMWKVSSELSVCNPIKINNKEYKLSK